jgi:hypothetical protein
LPYYLIHQPGKVASQTLEAAIRESTGGASRVVRLHYLSDNGLANLESMCQLPGIQADGIGGVLHQLTVARTVRDELGAYYSGTGTSGDVWVLTGVRDPLDLSIAAFFQNLPIYCPWLDYDESKVNSAADQLIDFFKSEFDRMVSGRPATSFQEALLDLKLRGPEPWFDDEFGPFHEVDVYERHVGLSQPFVSFGDRKFKFLIYRMELLSSSIYSILRRIETPTVVRNISDVNVGRRKNYSNVYRVFKYRFRPSSSVTDYYYGRRFFRHFYGERKR